MRDHRSLEAWREARATTGLAIRACARHWHPSASAAFHQLQRASLSVQLNIAEGYAFATSGRFRYHLSVAYGSAIETEDLLLCLMEEGLLPRDLAAEALEHSRRSARLLLGLLKRYRPPSTAPPGKR